MIVPDLSRPRSQAAWRRCTLNRPDAMNSFDADTARASSTRVEGFAATTRVRVLVIAGEGRAFSAGGDFNWVLTWPGLDAITRRSAPTP